MKISACIEMLFSEVDFYDRIALSADAGMDAVEFWNWPGKDVERIAGLTSEHGLVVATFVASHGGALVNPSERTAFVKGVKESIPVARTLECQTLLITVMNPGDKDGFSDLSETQMHASIVDGLKEVAHIVEDVEMVLAVEPLNVLVDHPGYYLTTSSEGFDIIREVDSKSVKLLFDIYHQQITEGNLLANILPSLDSISHFHVADVPGRHEPGTGEIAYGNIFAAIEKAGYSGFVGLEYSPTATSAETLEAVRSIAP